MDLKIKDVADLLHISETTVRRWLLEGKIPAYRLNKQYRFSRTEIEDWVLKKKLAVALNDQKQLLTSERIEEDLENESTAEIPRHTAGAMQYNLYRAVYRGGVLYDVPGETKEEVISKATQRIAQNFDLDPAVLTDLLLDREQLMPTSLNFGIAVPHTRDFLMKTHFDVITIVFPQKPIDYGALDGQPVDTLFFLLACDDKRHLNLLAKLAHLSNQETARSFLRTRPGTSELLEYIKAWESTLNF
jgi:nitrogen PTS system EIIA component